MLANLTGPGEVRHIWATVSSTDRQWRRLLVLRIFFEGAESPSVECPVGDFFLAGNAMRSEVHSSLPIETSGYGKNLNSYWHMPFHKSARVEITNDTPQKLWLYGPQTVLLRQHLFSLAAVIFPFGEQVLLHRLARRPRAAGRAALPRALPAGVPGPALGVVLVCEHHGRGELRGDGAQHLQRARWLVWVNPTAAVMFFAGLRFHTPLCCREGDDHFYIDGARTPQLVGTGTEDYFCDGW